MNETERERLLGEALRAMHEAYKAEAARQAEYFRTMPDLPIMHEVYKAEAARQAEYFRTVPDLPILGLRAIGYGKSGQ